MKFLSPFRDMIKRMTRTRILSVLIPVYMGIVLVPLVAHAAGDIADTIKTWFLEFLQWILLWTTNLVVLGLYTFSIGLGYLLSATDFVTHPIVQRGWPFIQGIVNIGFFLALIFLAVMIVLRLEGGLGVRRLLPRLLIAALLLNFSLVIGGVLIDISRVTMAIISEGIVGTPPDRLGIKLLTSSGLYSAVYDTFDPFVSWKLKWKAGGVKGDMVGTLKVGMVLLLSVVLFIAFIVIIVGFLIRYVMLLLLLVVSPVAYLGLALPQLERFSRMWWESFLKYVFYGPIALFTLALIVLFADDPFIKSASLADSLMAGFLQVSVILVTAIMGNRAGIRLGNFAAGTAIGYAMGASKRVLRAGKVPAYLTAGVAGGVYAGTAGRTAAGKKLAGYAGSVLRTPRNIRDLYKEGVEKRVNKALGIGDKSASAGTLAARRLGSADTKGVIEAIKAKAPVSDSRLNSDKLVAAAGALNKGELNSLITALNNQRVTAENAAETYRAAGDETNARVQDRIARDAEGRMTIVISNKDAARTISKDDSLNGQILGGAMGARAQDRLLNAIASLEREDQAQKR